MVKAGKARKEKNYADLMIGAMIEYLINRLKDLEVYLSRVARVSCTSRDFIDSSKAGGEILATDPHGRKQKRQERKSGS